MDDDNCETTQCINSTKIISYWNLIQHNKLIIIAYSIGKIEKFHQNIFVFLESSRGNHIKPTFLVKRSDH